MASPDPIQRDVGAGQPRWMQWVNIALCCALLSALGTAFGLARTATISQVENRRLAPMPSYSFGALYDSSYTRDLELYLADHFPLRERFVAAAFWLRDRRGFKVESRVFELGGGGLDEVESWGARGDAGAGDGGEEELPEPEAVLPGGPNEEGPAGEETDAGAGDELAVGPGEEEPEAETDGGAVKVSAGILSHRGRAVMLFKGTDETAQLFAKTVETYRRTFRGQAQVHVMVVPTAAAFYLPADQREKSRPQKENLQVMRGALDGGVDFIDLYAALEPHTQESIYYRTDHHWTALGAYYGYDAFCRGAVLAPVPLSWLVRKERPGSLGSLHRMTHDDSLTEDPEVFFEPAVASVAVRYAGEEETRAIRARAIDADAGGYLLFLGGDYGLWVARPKATSPRRALVVKNSFGNALVPFLLPHFERVVVMDYRYTVHSVVELVRQYRITDIIIVMDTITANDHLHRRRVREVLTGHDAAWTAGRVQHDGGLK